MNRREFLARASAAGYGFTALPPIFWSVFGGQNASASNYAYPKYTCYFHHGSGGFSMHYAVVPRAADGSLPDSLSNFAGVPASAVSGISNELGAQFWNVGSAKAYPNGKDCPFFTALRAKLAAAGALGHVFAVPIFNVTGNDSTSGCQVSPVGAIAQILSDLGIRPRSVLGAGLTNSASLNGTRPIYDFPSLTRSTPQTASDLYSVLEFSQTLASRIPNSTTRQSVVNVLAPTMRKYAEALLKEKLGSTPDEKDFLAAQSAANADLEAAKTPDPNFNAAALNPATNPNYSGIAQTMLGTFTNNTPTLLQAFQFNAALGLYCATGMATGGCDYHNTAATSTDAKDAELGTRMGEVLGLAYAMGQGMCAFLTTDGSVRADPNGIGDPAATQRWAGDDTGGGCSIMFVVPAPGDTITQLKYFLGAVDPSSGRTLGSTLFGTGPAASYAFLLNWLKLNGYPLDSADKIAGAAGLDSSLLPQMKKDAICFG